MRTAGLRSIRRRPYRVPTNSNHGHSIAPNLVKREFAADGPNRVWVSDTTLIRTGEGWLYLAVVIDVWSCKVVGWSISSTNNRHLVVDAFEMARGQRHPEPGSSTIRTAEAHTLLMFFGTRSDGPERACR
jgi:transposase InsO family protein